MNGTHYSDCGLSLFTSDGSFSVRTDPPPKNNDEHLHSWELFSFYEQLENGWYILDEIGDKYVSLSFDRFRDLVVLDNGLNVTVEGGKDEKIDVSFVNKDGVVLVEKVVFDGNGDDVTFVVGS